MDRATEPAIGPKHPGALKPIRAALRRAWKRCRYRINSQPVFVLGNQKTGTTAIAALLAKAAGLSTTLDIFYQLPAHIEADLLRKTLSFDRFLRDYPEFFTADLIKEPGLTFMYPDLSRRFPRGRHVFVLRDPRDNIRSMLNRLELPGNLSRLEPEHWQTVTNPFWKRILEGTLFGPTGHNYVETLAHRWNTALAVYQSAPDRFVLARYEDFVRDKVGYITRLAEQLGLQTRHDISAHVDIQYQPPGDHSVTWEQFFGPNLDLIEHTCAEGMNRYDYPKAPTPT